MTNGFYNTDNFSNVKIKKFVKEAIMLAYNVNCQSIIGYQRQIVKTVSISKYIDNAFSITDTELYVIDRFVYNQGVIKKELCEYEICLRYNSNFLYIFVNEDNFKYLVSKYKLKLKEW